MDQKLKLRPLTLEDIPSFARYANNFDIAKNLTDAFPHPYTEDHAKSFIEMSMKAEPRKIMAIEIAGEAVGAIGIHSKEDIMRKNMELGYWLGEPFWGRGIITEAVKKMVDYGFKNWDISRVYATPFGNNIGSQKVLEKAGFVLEAHLSKTIYKNGEFLDELIYAIRRENWTKKTGPA